MKLRIKDNNLRLRLTQSEVAQLGQGEAVRARIQFAPDQTLTYELVSQTEAAIAVHYREHTIQVVIPTPQAQAWAHSETVGIEATVNQPTHALQLLIEKDFQCLHQRPHEDERDNFTNPATLPAQ